ncbi:helix-turn-helix transcriptional regulator [Flavonifractor sp.]|uniref:helix-turn-helix domain-containing protein n=1 Tax=Flavonifractor sp. TaxID=2049025 RepID=UPI0025C70EAE|nr:helix-turn-helix transcriptional regulator [Flavonifractor sp.]
MKLSEKILYYRKKAGLSQEELAGRVGVSRQAVSKWELGDAAPEVDKLRALAREFGVTVDELISEEAPREPEQAPPPQHSPTAGWLGRMVGRWGWLAGVYIALSGLGVALVGGLARFAFSRMFRMVSAGWGAMDPFGSGGWELVLPDGTVTSGGMSGISSMGQVFLTFATVILAVGLVITLAGAVLAVVLYRKGRKNG